MNDEILTQLSSLLVTEEMCKPTPRPQLCRLVGRRDKWKVTSSSWDDCFQGWRQTVKPVVHKRSSVCGWRFDFLLVSKWTRTAQESRRVGLTKLLMMVDEHEHKERESTLILTASNVDRWRTEASWCRSSHTLLCAMIFDLTVQS